MLMLLTPSKTMDFMSQVPIIIPRQHPLFLEKTKKITSYIKTLDTREIARLMKVSPAIAADVKHMYQGWRADSGKPALWAYNGDVYKGMKAGLLSAESAWWAEKHLLIMSGLYGMVRPFDMIAPYRLEMKAALMLGDAKDLYAFWGDTLATYVAAHANGLVYNLCSDEYVRVVTRRLAPTVNIITPVFYDKKPDGKIGQVSIYSKMMRGVMARWMIDHRTESPGQLQEFTMHGYAYDTSLSKRNAPAFYREKMKPLVFS